MDRRIQEGRGEFHHAGWAEGDSGNALQAGARAARRPVRDTRNQEKIPAHPFRSHHLGTRQVTFDFDREIPRAGTASVKHDGAAATFGSADLIPMWSRTMDFAAPEAITAR